MQGIELQQNKVLKDKQGQTKAHQGKMGTHGSRDGSDLTHIVMVL
jgi:hypothetical protein